VIDTHTADGLKVAQAHLSDSLPMIVLETALPIKFADTIVEAWAVPPARPPVLRASRTARGVPRCAADVRSQGLHRGPQRAASLSSRRHSPSISMTASARPDEVPG
jgi:threonine synthase